MSTETTMAGKFEIEAKDDDIFVAHFTEPPLEGLEVLNQLEAAAPVKEYRLERKRVALEGIVAQYGYNGVYEGMNAQILRAHKRAFPGAYQRAYVSAQMIRACLEPYTASPSMHGLTMEFPYDWSSMQTTQPETIDELLAIIRQQDPYSGVSPQEHFEARILGSKWGEASACEWVQLRDSMIDGPLLFRVPGTRRGWDDGQPEPPTIAPKLAWKEIDGHRTPVTNTEAGIHTVSEPTRLRYQDGTMGLVLTATHLGITQQWPTSHAFTETELARDEVRQGTINMEAAQVPLLAQVSAEHILNHPEFLEVITP